MIMRTAAGFIVVSALLALALAHNTITDSRRVLLPKGTATNESLTCASTAFEVLGQAWRVDFSTGGLLPNEKNLSYQASVVGDPTMRRVFPTQTSGPEPEGQRTVTIIVVDNFNLVPLKVKRDAPQSQGPVLAVRVKHGELVVSHLSAMLESDRLQNIGNLNFRRGPRTVIIKKLQVLPDSASTTARKQFTGQFVKEIQSALANPNGDVVVNMSLAILPCPVLTGYKEAAASADKQNSRLTFTDYLDRIRLLNPGLNGTTPELLELVLHRIPTDDPIVAGLIQARKLADSKKDQKLTYIASSGNFGLPISTMPGGMTLPDVISVGATSWAGRPPGLTASPNGQVKAEPNWSDAADFNSVGEWFRLSSKGLSQVCDSSCSSTEWPQPVYRGTSFAAPSVAALMASRGRLP